MSCSKQLCSAMKDWSVALLSLTAVQQVCNILAATWSSGHAVLKAVNVC